MAKTTGLVLAAGGVALANELVFAPLAKGNNSLQFSNVNWRIIPATGILAIVMAGLEKVADKFAVGLSGLVLLSVIIIPYGKAPSPAENLGKAFGKKA